MSKLIGDKKFYKMVLAVAIPIMVQNGITNFVGLLDNIMVGSIGTEQMSGVAIVNQLLFVCNLCIFGGVSGAGIFGAQFYGQQNHEGVKHTFRFKLYICLAIIVISFVAFASSGRQMIQMYLHEGNDASDITLALDYGLKYMKIIVIGLIPFALVQAYAGTLRETGETVVPMVAGIVAVFVNLFFNYLLIFGNCGFPKMGVEGAAIATVISRFVECGIVVIWTHKNKERNKFIQGVYRSVTIPKELVGKIIAKGTPLLLNETLWAAAVAILTQCYSVRGLSVVAGLNISQTIANVFNVVYIAMGNVVAIIVGQLLGAGKMEEAKETDAKLIFFSVSSCLVLGTLMALIAPLFTQIYNTSEEVKTLAVWFIRITALCMPLNAFMHAAYFTLRSGGKTIVTFFFDSVYMWVFSIPVAFCLTRYTGWNIVPVYLLCQLVDIIKCVIGFVLVKKGVWIQNIVES